MSICDMQVISSRKNAVVSHMKKLGSDRAYRCEHNEFLCDGIRLLREAVSSNCVVTAVFVSSEKTAREFTVSAPVYVVPEDIMKYVSPLKTAQEVIFSCAMPQRRELDISARNIILDGVQDPGNVGTVLRGAVAFGIDSVVLVGACADPYNPKTVRATMGAVFRQNIVQTDYAELAEFVLQGLKLNGAALDERSKDVRSVGLADVSVAIGSEGAGLSDEVRALCAQLVIIPMEPAAESLNAGVAANILMYLMYGGSENADA